MWLLKTTAWQIILLMRMIKTVTRECFGIKGWQEFMPKYKIVYAVHHFVQTSILLMTRFRHGTVFLFQNNFAWWYHVRIVGFKFQNVKIFILLLNFYDYWNFGNFIKNCEWDYWIVIIANSRFPRMIEIVKRSTTPDEGLTTVRAKTYRTQTFDAAVVFFSVLIILWK